jgi:hypothetical protein
MLASHLERSRRSDAINTRFMGKRFVRVAVTMETQLTFSKVGGREMVDDDDGTQRRTCGSFQGGRRCCSTPWGLGGGQRLIGKC